MKTWNSGGLEVTADGPRVTLIGELDLSNVDIAEWALRSAERVQGTPEIVLDLEQLRFIDSIGVRWVISAMQRHSLDGDRLSATGTTRGVQQVFEMTGLARRLPPYGSAPWAGSRAGKGKAQSRLLGPNPRATRFFGVLRIAPRDPPPEER